MKNGMSFVVFVFIVLLGIFFLLPEPVFAKMKLENGVYIIDNISGSATINKRKKSVVREEAKKAAYNTLSEKLLDEIMPGIKEKENYDAVLEKVSSKISGLVKNFKIDSEQVSENDTLNIVGTCKINERALDDLIGSDIITLLGNPRVMILVDEKVGGGSPFISTTESELLRIFEQAGYLIVDPDQARTLLNLAPATAFDDPVKLSQAARTLRADIIVIGKATAGAYTKQKVHGVTLYGVSGTVQLKAILTQTAYQISSKTVSSSTGRKPVGSVGSGADRCFRSAAAQAAEQIVYKIAYNMASAGSVIEGINVNIKIANVMFSDVEKIEKQLGELKGKLFERSYSNNFLEIDFVSKYSARDLASFLSEHGVNINSLTTQTINANVVKEIQKEVIYKNSAISVKISDISSYSEAGEIENKLRDYLKESSKELSGKYNDNTLEIVVYLPDGAEIIKIEKNVAEFLEKNGIKIESFSSGAIYGKLNVDNEKSGGLLNWGW